MSNTPKTDALFFPYGRDHTAAASPSFLTCMTEYELLEMENAALREQLKKYQKDAERYRWAKDHLFIGYIDDDVCTSVDDNHIDSAMKEEGK